MKHDHQLNALAELDDWELEHSHQDVRGRPLVSRTGERLGTVERMLVDRDRERVAALVLDNGRTVPVEQIEIESDRVLLTGTGDGITTGAAAGDEERIPIAEEELVVGKRAVEHGTIRVRSRVVEKPVQEQVSLRDEHVEIERRPADEKVGDADALFRERTVEVRETDEVPVAAKEARVVEEVVVSKDVDTRLETVSDTVRRTEVDVDRNGSGGRDARR